MSEKARIADTSDTDPRGDDDSTAETSVTVEGDDSEAVVSNDSQLTVEVDADVSAASDAIESLQTDVEALTDELNEAAERVEDISLSDTDFGLPAPSPADVQAELGDTESDGQVWVPAGPLYELAKMWAGIRVTEPFGNKRAKSYRKARKESGEWLKEELDELTGTDDE